MKLLHLIICTLILFSLNAQQARGVQVKPFENIRNSRNTEMFSSPLNLKSVNADFKSPRLGWDLLQTPREDGKYFAFDYAAGFLDSSFYNRFNLSYEWRLDLFHRYNIGLQWNLGYLRTTEGLQQVHTTGAMAYYYTEALFKSGLLNAPGAERIAYLLLVLDAVFLALPDGIIGHFGLGPNIEISPYANFIGLDFVRDWHWPRSIVQPNMSYGIKTSYVFLNTDFHVMACSFTAETRKTKYYPWNFNFGIGIDYYLW